MITCIIISNSFLEEYARGFYKCLKKERFPDILPKLQIQEFWLNLSLIHTPEYGYDNSRRKR